MTRKIFCAFAILALATTAGAGNATDLSKVTRHRTVSYSDLDLSLPTGVQAFLNRLNAASKRVCGGVPDIHNMTMTRYFDACYSKAMNGAVAQVNAPLVTQIFAQLGLKPTAAPEDTTQQVASQEYKVEQKPNLFRRFGDLF